MKREKLDTETKKALKEIEPSTSGDFVKIITFAPNFYKIICTNGALYISYDKVIAFADYVKQLYFIDYFYYDASKTTMKHLCMALDEKSIKDIRRKINDGIYILADFNNELPKYE